MDKTILKLAETIQSREAPGAKEGVYHKSQEQSAAMTTRFGIDMTRFPKNDGESDIAHFQRTYSTFQPVHQAAAKKLSKADPNELLKVIWNTGIGSKPSIALTNADMSTPVGRNKLFASINSYVGVQEKGGSYWSAGLVKARAKDWNAIAKAYAPDQVISDIKVYKQKDSSGKELVMRQYLNSKGQVLRTMYNKKPLAPSNKNVIGTTIKIGG